MWFVQKDCRRQTPIIGVFDFLYVRHRIHSRCCQNVQSLQLEASFFWQNICCKKHRRKNTEHIRAINKSNLFHFLALISMLMYINKMFTVYRARVNCSSPDLALASMPIQVRDNLWRDSLNSDFLFKVEDFWFYLLKGESCILFFVYLSYNACQTRSILFTIPCTKYSWGGKPKDFDANAGMNKT